MGKTLYFWSDAETEYLRQHVKVDGPKRCGEALGRTRTVIESKLRRMRQAAYDAGDEAEYGLLFTDAHIPDETVVDYGRATPDTRVRGDKLGGDTISPQWMVITAPGFSCRPLRLREIEKAHPPHRPEWYRHGGSGASGYNPDRPGGADGD
tara:strand:- start:3852 stop:4304 length:453 start_codon:yes stop_codon:yes gene_type:complete